MPTSTASLLSADESRHRDTVLRITTETPLPLQRRRPCCEPLLSCSDVTPGPVSGIDDMLAAPSFPPLLFVPPWPIVLLAALVLGGLALACTTFRAPLAAAVGTTEPAFVKQLLEFASIPLTSLVVTYVHIWLALYLTFYPAAYVGCLQLPGTNLGLGWQGIVPFKRVKFARKATQLMTTKLITVPEMLGRLEPHRMAAAMGDAYLDSLADRALAAAAAAGAPRLWEWQPEWVRQALARRVRRAARVVLRGALVTLTLTRTLTLTPTPTLTRTRTRTRTRRTCARRPRRRARISSVLTGWCRACSSPTRGSPRACSSSVDGRLENPTPTPTLTPTLPLPLPLPLTPTSTPTLTPTLNPPPSPTPLTPTLTPTQELAFIRNTGAAMGAGFGLLQMVCCGPG